MRWSIVMAVVAACGGDKVGQGEGAVEEVDVATDGGPPDESAPDDGGALTADAGELTPVGDAGVDVPDEGAADCPCVVDTVRYCDYPAYCAWGAQICAASADGIHRWTDCEEENIAPGCDPYGALARPYEWHYAGGYWDGQIDDPDGDGVVTSEPDWWLNPTAQDCAIRAGQCVQDAWDLDLDGDIEESLGNCLVEECGT